MKDHCASLELSQKLKEAGFPQDTEFWWVSYDSRSPHLYLESRRTNGVLGKRCKDQIAAPLATELLEKMPAKIIAHNRDNWLHITFVRMRGFSVYYGDISKKQIYTNYEDSSLCNALAMLYIYLKKEEL